jgi:hypothetical protein
MQKYSLAAVDNSRLASLLGPEPPVVFAGSGISLWAPSNLPTGNAFTKSVFSLLFPREQWDPENPKTKILYHALKSLPFEVINERCPDASSIETLLRSLYDRYESNPVHELLAKLLSEGKLRSVVTPNYDCCLDAAIAKVSDVVLGTTQGNIRRVVNWEHAASLRSINQPVYFKIHGSTDDKSGRSLIFRLNQEGVLERWKRELFRDLLRDRTVLVIGYSGSDFDICPEIALARTKKILWNALNEWDEGDITPNIKFLDRNCDLTVIFGDMRELLSRLYCPVTANFGKSELDLDHLLDQTFDETCKRLWRLWLYNNINYNRAALQEMDIEADQQYDPQTRIFFLSEYAAASASSGKYRSAAKLHDQAARVARGSLRDTHTYTTQTLIACDTWRCYGSFLRSIWHYRKAASLIRGMAEPPPHLFADLDRNLILLIRHPYDFFQRFRMPRLMKKMQSIAAEAVQRSIKYYRENGDWYQLQQIGLWGERFQLHMHESTRLEEYETPLANEGYRQLNFPMGRMMSFRHSLRGLGRPLTRQEVQEAQALSNEAKELGILPEVWKLRLLILRTAHRKDRSFTDFLEFARAFGGCQYTLLFGIWRLLMGE